MIDYGDLPQWAKDTLDESADRIIGMGCESGASDIAIDAALAADRKRRIKRWKEEGRI